MGDGQAVGLGCGLKPFIVVGEVRELKAAGAEQIFLEYEHGDSKIKSRAAVRSRSCHLETAVFVSVNQNIGQAVFKDKV